MSSSSFSYVVAPNTSATTPYIPEQTQLNGTGPLVDLVPQILVNAENPTGIALGTIPGSTVVYTSANSVSAGTYRVEANFILQSPTGSAWDASEAMLLTIATTANTGVVTNPEMSMQTAEFFFVDANLTIFATVSGLLQLNATAFPNCLVTRGGANISTNKTGAIISFTIQKIA
jgi:hypothetical protein